MTTVMANDPDSGAVLTYSIDGGADAAKFSIHPTTGALSFAAAPNYEAPADAGADNTYQVVVKASDGSPVRPFATAPQSASARDPGRVAAMVER